MNWEIEAEFLDKVSPTVTIAKIVFKYLFENYEVKTISDIADTTSGGTPLRGHGDYYGGNIPWIKSGELKDGLITEYEETITELGLKNSSAKIYPKGTLVLALYGATAGKVGILNFDSASNQAVAAIYHNDEIEKDYLLWFFKQKRSEFIEISFGAAQPNISQAVVKKTPIPVPNKSIQKDVALFLNRYEKEKNIDLPKSLVDLKDEIVRIHTILSNRKKLIEETTLQQTYLQQLRQAILQEAVQGKLTEQNTTDEPASKLLERIKVEKQHLIAAGKLKKQKELPPITNDEIPFELPKGWVWCRLEELCNYVVDCPHSTPKFEKEGKNCIDTTSMDQGIILYDRLRKVSKQTFDERNRRLIPQENDIVFSREGTVGMAVLIPPKFEVCLGQRVMLFRTSSLVFSEFFRYALISPMFVSQWQTNHIGAASKHINIRDLKIYLIPLPPLAEQKRIVAKVQQLLQMVNQLEQQVQQSQTQAQQLLQVVLQEAFGGKVKEYEENEVVTMAAEG